MRAQPQVVELSTMRKLLDYSTQIDLAMLPTLKVAAVMREIPAQPKPLTVPAYVARIAQRYAAQDGLSEEAYIAKLVLRDQVERRELAAMA